MKTRRYIIEMGLCLTAYAVLLFVSLQILNHGVGNDWLRLTVSVLPILPCLITGYVVLKHIRQLDELQQKMQLEAISFSFIATALVTFTYGFLENMGLPGLSMFVVWPLMATFWVIGQIIARYRYT
ncbi:MAG: hypothetical protein ABJN40_22530 [Sneathiella sp.]